MSEFHRFPVESKSGVLGRRGFAACGARGRSAFSIIIFFIFCRPTVAVLTAGHVGALVPTRVLAVERVEGALHELFLDRLALAFGPVWHDCAKGLRLQSRVRDDQVAVEVVAGILAIIGGAGVA
eukprot:CAMPEP_0171597762 /NCGR_PEP_ID=MMETSP0990-20121206/2738_1 /TAXON_ID=483369 /ORGANISM="non described non described, Strain CCMP2098" /LENGTH=123 /DNA_ID=CAMNT_0012159225 /DNA_START=876 /DNA_END=1247 /DNA_ORIENTATION=+